MNRNFEAGKIHGLALSVDNDGDFCAKASTNTDTFIVIVQHKVLENSSAQLQGKALADVLHILEPGDRMDKAIFARYCEKLKQKYNIIKMGIHDGCPAAYIVPSRLSPQDAGVNLGAVSDLRNSGRAIAEAAVAAAAAAGRRKDHEGVTCDGCGIINFPGKSFKCQVCENYDLCEECKLSCISTKGHNNNHQMQETIPSQDALNELLIQLLGVAVAGAAAGDKSNHGGRRAVSDDSHKAPKDPTKVHKYGHNGCFRATKLLKESGQANVYLGKQNNSQDVVLKIYHKTTDWDDCSKEVIRLMELPEHDHVIRVLDFFEEPKPCVVMPFIAGCDLMDYIEKNGPMDEFSALIVLTNIAKGLRHLHLHHVIHKDMKSPNILIELPQFRVVLIDLGMGEYIGNDTHELQADQPEGTLLWMAPEMMVTGKYNEKLDIYALGKFVDKLVALDHF